MKVLGSKFFGQENAVFLIDSDKKEIFAINGDRISRIKKDNYDVSPALIAFGQEKLQKIDILSYPFNNFKGKDALLETKGTSYYWLNWQRLLRNITKPKYRSDLNKKNSIFEQIIIFLKSLFVPKIFFYKLIRNYYWNKYVADQLNEDFHKGRINSYIRETLSRYNLDTKVIEYFDHHTCHAFSAYYFSPFAYSEDSIVFTLDEHGDEAFSKVFLFKSDNTFEEIAASKTDKFWIRNNAYVTSVAGMYSNFTEAMDLIRSSDEGKVEALAAYGKPDQNLLLKLNNLYEIKDFSFCFNTENYKELNDLNYLKEVRTKIGDENFCSTIQKWLEDTVVDYLNEVHKSYPLNNICLAGGAIANVILNYNIRERTPFKNMYVIPAMGDEGAAAGAAIISSLNAGLDLRWLKNHEMPYFGPSYSQEEVKEALTQFIDINFEYIGKKWPEIAAESISRNRVIAIFHGKMEFGPRALGNRSILASPLDKDSRDKINTLIKKRPMYQPFCPSVLESERKRLFKNTYKHKHMATAFMIRDEYREILSSGIHVDGTARPQFVEEKDNPSFFRILEKIKSLTDFGMVINTSFNLHGRTIVNTPSDAIRDFLDCNMDELYLEGFKITRKTENSLIL